MGSWRNLVGESIAWDCRTKNVVSDRGSALIAYCRGGSPDPMGLHLARSARIRCIMRGRNHDFA
jgi:hypothetical protein